MPTQFTWKITVARANGSELSRTRFCARKPKDGEEFEVKDDHGNAIRVKIVSYTTHKPRGPSGGDLFQIRASEIK
jgi:hypothetical protein